MSRILDIANALGSLDCKALQQDCLERAAARIEDAVRQALSRSPGETHTAPWQQSGALRDSIAHSVEGAQAVIGSTSDVAVYQELGTRTDPPRPFLAPAGAELGDDVAESIGAAFAEALRQATARG